MSKKITANLENAVHPPEKDIQNDYETQGHLKTLMDAHEIMGDSDKMAKVHKLAGRHHKALKGIKSVGGQKPIRSIDDLKKIRNEKAMSPQLSDMMGDSDQDGE